MVVMPDSNLVTTFSDKEEKDTCILRMWNPADGKLVKSSTIFSRAVIILLALSDEELAIGSWEGSILIFNLFFDEVVTKKEKAHEYIYSLAKFANDFLVSAGNDFDGVSSVNVWNLEDLTLLQVIPYFQSEATNPIALFSNDKLLASTCDGKTIKLWSICRV